ncbi:FecR family protein [Sinomicrobium soli]|uniref:FecR family protein n=1 Tax=Sinomicrobium sp. N-1-3-6 TaxID=2219864 RepID=UPI000DCB1FFE|nr:FecR domain-containing protein [Sinomicrobium sp. N-1-3-6]RAV30390.1 hypothetical protein DN748_02475 [Sinomicrobium sp. N-1-3-6]
MNEKELHQLLDKYLNGQCSNEEKELLDKLFDSYDSRNVYSLSERQDTAIAVKKEMFLNIKRDIRAKEQRSKRNRIRYRAVIVAASFLLLVGLGTGIWQYRNHLPSQQLALHTVSSPFGEKYTVTLEDGSVIKLNAGSTLSFPEKFSGPVRRVELTGEAFFEVTPDPERPFIILAQGLRTTVLGTSFNIQAYPERKSVEVTVATGKVRVSNDTADKPATPHFLTPDQQAVYDKTTGNVRTRTVSTSEITGWTRGILQFDDTPLQEVVPVLERWYGVSISLDKALEQCHISATFENAGLEVVLESIAFTKKDMQYEFITEKKIHLKGQCSH